MARRTLGLDLGGTKIAAGVLEDERLVAYLERPTPRSGPEGLTAALVEAARAVAPSLDVEGVGVGVPGPLDFERGVVRFAPNLPGVKDWPLKATLEARLGRPVVVENDANAAALAEHHLGAARGARHSLFVTVSTGIGGGVVLDGRVHHGAFGQGGEIGHLVVLPEGPVCGCGNRGCLEALASGRALARDGSYALGRPVTAPELFASPEPKARAVIERAAGFIGLALASLQRVFDPEVFVLGGGVALGGGEPFLRQVEAAYLAHQQNWRAAELRLARLGRKAGVIGAALAARTP